VKRAINWKLFFSLFSPSVITAILVLPYVLALTPKLADVFTPLMFAGSVFQSVIVFGAATFFGLHLAQRVGFGLPVLERITTGKAWRRELKAILGISIGMGLTVTILIIFLGLASYSVSFPLFKLEMALPVWNTVLASLYGGIAEEVLLRLFVMTLLVWLPWRFWKERDGTPTTVGIWAAIILSSVLFGLGHLPFTSGLTAITPAIIVRAVLMNGVAGVAFGWLYWKKGLESAMIAHCSCDIALHTILPKVTAFFLT